MPAIGDPQIARIDIAEGKPAAARSCLDNLLRSDARISRRWPNWPASKKGRQRHGSHPLAGESARRTDRRVRGAIMLAALPMRLAARTRRWRWQGRRGKAPTNLVALASLIQAQLALGDRRGRPPDLVDATRYANYDPDAQLEVAKLPPDGGRQTTRA